MSHSHPPISVILVHRDRPDAIGRTVRAFREQSVPTQIIVVDNGSMAETQEKLRDLDGAVELILSNTNLGFGPGGNVGLRRWLRDHGTEWVALAPHDALPDQTTIETMLDALEGRQFVGLASADVGDGTVPIVDPYLGPIEAPSIVAEGFELSGYPHGTLMMLRRRCIEEIGLFDERYFAYCEETELALRGAAAGWQCGLIRGAMVRNPGMSVPIESVAYLQLRNTLLLLREYYGRRQAAFRLLIALAQTLLGIVYPPARGLHWSPRGRLLAVRDHLRGRYGPPPAAIDV